MCGMDDIERKAEEIIDELFADFLHRDTIVKLLVEGLTQMGVVVVYTDDTVKRRVNREEQELLPDPPMPNLGPRKKDKQ